MKNSRAAGPRSVTSILSDVIYDVPAWLRGLLVVVGLCAVVVVVVTSLTGNQDYTVEVDKLLHFGGYMTLATIFVLGLRPAWYLPALILLGLVGFAVEYLQPFNARSRDMSDAIANLVGLTAGTVVGLLLRVIFRTIRTSANQLRMRQRRRSYSAGAIILRQGAEVSHLHIIERGEVRLTRDADGRPQIVGTLGPGDVIGLLGVLQKQPQFTTVEAVGNVTVQSLGLEDLLETTSGKPEPIVSVLKVMAKYIRSLADRVAEVEREIP